MQAGRGEARRLVKAIKYRSEFDFGTQKLAFRVFLHRLRVTLAHHIRG
jgi:hypothetical protein